MERFNSCLCSDCAILGNVLQKLFLIKISKEALKKMHIARNHKTIPLNNLF